MTNMQLERKQMKKSNLFKISVMPNVIRSFSY